MNQAVMVGQWRAWMLGRVQPPQTPSDPSPTRLGQASGNATICAGG
jgi:hypothetical protein